MTDIIFHIGFPKCASTTLQKTVFPTDPGYLGTDPKTGKEIKKRINYAEVFQNLSPIGVKIAGNFKQAEKWKHAVLEYKKRHAPHLNRLIISSEFFTQKNKLRDRPMIKFLKRFDEDIWDEGSVKIVLVIRNQAEKIASSYAQDSNTKPHASQADFVQYVPRYLKKHGSLMDYSVWIEELQDAFGKDSVQVLLMEDIGTIDYWTNLKSFCDLKEFEPESMLDTEGDNVKRRGKNCWTIQPFDSEFKATVWAHKILRLAWPHHVKKELRESAQQALVKMFTSYYESSHYRSNSESRDVQISLTDSLQEQIKTYYSDSNRRLAELVDRDLSKLGY